MNQTITYRVLVCSIWWRGARPGRRPRRLANSSGRLTAVPCVANGPDGRWPDSAAIACGPLKLALSR